ncbi:amidohydrolase family protein [Scopulibacillus darangshiensis]|uniref:amidohydrolase family protein n=1 Tax=Scopulibacillus darangshiensis TaxID=442528 RepID=UPI00104FF6FF|nr:amidohydrolase family protein [Scopulibacillus darangshiensis]
MNVDAHQHFWNLEKVNYPWLSQESEIINRTFEAPELEPLLRVNGIDKTIVVQAMDSYQDTEYMIDTAARYDWIAGIVGWVPLNRPEEADQKLEAFIRHPKFKGVRHLIHEEEDPDWLIRDDVIEGLRVLASYGLPFDVVAVFPNHLKHVPTIAEKVPDLKMVIDHLAKPPIKVGEIESWAKEISKAAEYTRVYAKISGLNTAASEKWTSEDLKLYIDVALEKFGAKRLMFGSDWPVANLAGDYHKVWTETNKVLDHYSPLEKEAILGGTAIEFYHLEGE